MAALETTAREIAATARIPSFLAVSLIELSFLIESQALRVSHSSLRACCAKSVFRLASDASISHLIELVGTT
jgi:hypothetical protein